MEGKKLFLLIFLLTALTLILRFPWREFLEKMVRDFQKKSPQLLAQMDFDTLNLKLFPLGLEFKKISLEWRKKQFPLDSLQISLPLKERIALKRPGGLQRLRVAPLFPSCFGERKKQKRAGPG